MNMAALLDPKFKTLVFLNPNKMTEAVKWLKAECANVNSAKDERPSASTRSTEPPSTTQQPTPSLSIYLLLVLF